MENTENTMKQSYLSPVQIGENLRKIRQKKGFTQLALAKTTGITQATICYMEHGKSLTDANLEKVCNILNVRLGMIIGEEERKPLAPKKKKKIKKVSEKVIKEFLEENKGEIYRRIQYEMLQ